MRKSVKNTLVLLLLFLLGIQTNHLIIYYTLFSINRDALAMEVCEQKTDDCNACCYLSKKMAEDTDKADPIEKNASQRNVKISEYTLLLIELADIEQSDNNFFNLHSGNILTGYLTTLKHPPKSFIV